MEAKKATAIVKWIDRIKKSKLPISKFFEKHNIPFSRARYFIYKKRLEEYGPAGLIDNRCTGGNRKITLDQEAFLKGIVKRDQEVSLGWLQQALMEEFSCKISLSAVSRALTRVEPEREFKVGGRPKTKAQGRYREGTNLVLLDHDVSEAFPTDKAVNEALRLVIQLTKLSRVDKRLDGNP